MQARELPEGWDSRHADLPRRCQGHGEPRFVGQGAQCACATTIPWLIGGSADLAPSTKTRLTFEGAGDLEPGTLGGRNMHFGIREHAMGAVVNGMALSERARVRVDIPDLHRLHEDRDPAGGDDGDAGHLCLHARFDRPGRGRPDASADRAACRRCAPCRVWSSCGRATPTKWSRRGGSSSELRHQPACLVLSRQALPTLDRTKYAPAAGVARGAYVLADAKPASRR